MNFLVTNTFSIDNFQLGWSMYALFGFLYGFTGMPQSLLWNCISIGFSVFLYFRITGCSVYFSAAISDMDFQKLIY